MLIKPVNSGRSFISLLNDTVLYLFSGALALGTINPFRIHQSFDPEPESLLMPILAIVFSFIVLCRYGFKNTPKIIIVFALLMFFGCLLGDLFYDYYSMDFKFLTKLLVVLLFFFSCITYFSNNPQKIKTSLIVFSVTCVIVLLVVYFFNNGNTIEINKGRLFIFGENANSTSSRMLIAALCFSYDIICNKRKWLVRVLEILSLLLLLLYVIQSGSRGSLISVVFGIILLLLFSKTLFTRKTLFIVLGVIIVTKSLPVLVNNENIAIFERLQELEEGNVRSELMLNAVNIYKDYPVFGAGNNGYQVEKMKRNYSPLDSHCIVTSIMAIGGTFALVFFICFWITLLKKTLLIRKTNVFPLIIDLCITFIALKTGGVITFAFLWYCYAICYSISVHEFSNQIIDTVN